MTSDLPPASDRVVWADDDRAEEPPSGTARFDLAPTAPGRDGFFEAVRATLPLDPPLVSNRSWDALSDSLWQGLADLPETTVVLDWRDAGAFGDGAPEVFREAVDVLGDVADSLTDPEATAGRPKDVRVRLHP